MLGGNAAGPEYSRVVLPLSSLLEGKFFNEFIKRGMLNWEVFALIIQS